MKLDLVFILVIGICILLFVTSSSCSRNMEHFDAASDAKAAVNAVYQADVGAIRTLADVAAKLQAGNFTVPSHLISTGDLVTTRQRLRFWDESASDHSNHTIYNNYKDIDGEGSFDGMKMNVYAGLKIRTGNANGVVPKEVVNVNNNGMGVAGVLNVSGNITSPTIDSLQAQINSLQAQINTTNSNVSSLNTTVTNNYNNSIRVDDPVFIASTDYGYLGSCNGASCGGGVQSSFGRSIGANWSGFKMKITRNPY
jgi:hypothetical protein